MSVHSSPRDGSIRKDKSAKCVETVMMGIIVLPLKAPSELSHGVMVTLTSAIFQPGTRGVAAYRTGDCEVHGSNLIGRAGRIGGERRSACGIPHADSD